MNRLSLESSPYLLQHAHNPVDWFPWGDDAFQKANLENKPMLISIGYSACHWCHVMEKESFENESIARFMNEHFVCIKVDREERPDVDAIYMDSLHAMGARGGWPLNVFVLPNARPFYGVTYLPPKNWGQLLQGIQQAFSENYDALAKSADGFTENLLTSEVQKFNLTGTETEFRLEDLDLMFEKLKKNFDPVNGGMDRAPKFVMPSIYKFLLRYYDLTLNPEALRQIELSLNRVALGGIYDHVGGGWARYSVDGEWFIPHFEKMLYDNAQLLSVYSEAFSLTGQSLYRLRIEETLRWLHREMQSSEGGFYSALDADSEGIEGKFYIWTADELREVLGPDFEWFSQLYNISDEGNWEHGYNHLHLTDLPASILQRLNFDLPGFEARYQEALELLATARKEKTRPGTDDKILASWNGLLLKGFCDAYRALGDESTRISAIRLGHFIREKFRIEGKLYHSYKEGRTTIPAFLEDYAAVADGFVALYQITFDEEWLQLADQLIAYTVKHFWDKEEGYFYFTDQTTQQLIAQKKEIFDNVIPSSNSILAHALFNAGHILDKAEYLEIAQRMLAGIKQMLLADVQWATNWAALYCQFADPVKEIVLVGDQADELRKDLDRFFVPNRILLGTTTESQLPLIDGKTPIQGQTAIYVCKNKTCQLPVTTVKEALLQIH